SGVTGHTERRDEQRPATGWVAVVPAEGLELQESADGRFGGLKKPATGSALSRQESVGEEERE
ncbi:MAG: hypothetical protein L0191_09460, partial [Acidobacteria bacterium]|nr:hypothetical protein [Acidobacteriota bacterium]